MTSTPFALFVYLVIIAIVIATMIGTYYWIKIINKCGQRLIQKFSSLFRKKKGAERLKQSIVEANKSDKEKKKKAVLHTAFLKHGDQEIPIACIRNGSRTDIPSLPESRNWSEFDTPAWRRKDVIPSFSGENVYLMAEAFIPG